MYIYIYIYVCVCCMYNVSLSHKVHTKTHKSIEFDDGYTLRTTPESSAGKLVA